MQGHILYYEDDYEGGYESLPPSDEDDSFPELYEDDEPAVYEVEKLEETDESEKSEEEVEESYNQISEEDSEEEDSDDESIESEPQGRNLSWAESKVFEDLDDEEEKEDDTDDYEDNDSDTDYDRDYSKDNLMELFLNLPLEIFLSICSQLELPDLLALSHSSSFFYSNLLRFPLLWKESRKNAGLTSTLSIPLNDYTFAVLLYDTRCSICKRCPEEEQSYIVDFMYRIRFCPDCFHATNRGFVSCISPGAPFVPWNLERCLFRTSTSYGYGGGKYYLPHSCPVATRFYELQAMPTISSSELEYPSETLLSFVKDRLEVVQKLRNDAAVLSQCNLSKLHRDAQILQKEQQRRKICVENKVIKIGYDPNVVYHLLWTENEFLDSLPAFTRTNWKRIIWPKLEPLVEEITEERYHERSRREYRKRLLNSYYFKLRAMFNKRGETFFLRLSDYLRIPVVLDMSFNDHRDFSDDVIESREVAILSGIEQFRRKNTKELLLTLHAAREEAVKLSGSFHFRDPAPLNVTDLEDSAEEYRYDGNHPHLSFITSLATCRACEETESLANFPTHDTKCWDLTLENFQFDPRRIYGLWKMLKLLKWKEENTDEEDMDAVGNRFVCEGCRGNPMDWRAAISHALNAHYEGEFSDQPSFFLVE